MHTAADNVLARIDRGERDLRIYLVADLGQDQKLVANAAREVHELAGKRLGVDAAWSGHALLLYTLLERAGVRRGDWTAIPVGGSERRLEALMNGEVDAALLAPPNDVTALTAGARLLADCAAEFPRHPGLTVASRPSWAASHGDALTAYLRALIGGQRAVGATVPTARDQADALLGALALRRALVGGATPMPSDVARAFDPAPLARADPSLA